MISVLRNVLYAIVLIYPSIAQSEAPESTLQKTEAAASTPQKKTICLNMIVKNESAVITRCLTSILPLIDYWVIVDTGSSDRTQDIIKDFMKAKGIPGELHERQWVNFSHNRNEALELAKNKSDYVLLIDADDYLIYDANFQLPSLDKDVYHITIKHGGMKYTRPHIINNHVGWKWIGVLHEGIFPVPADYRTAAIIENVTNMYTAEGARSKDPLKFQKDAEVLEKALLEEPNNTRYVFYLAQSYRDAENSELAIKNYEKRASMGGWDEEIFTALLESAQLQHKLDKDNDAVIKSYNRAFDFRPSRLEPLYYLTKYYESKQENDMAYQTAKQAEAIPRTGDLLFVQHWLYDYGMILELSACAYWTGRFEECQRLSEELLKRDLPPDIRHLVTTNLNFANDRVKEKSATPTEPIAVLTTE